MPETYPAAAPTRRPRPATLRLLGVLFAVLTVLTGVGTASAAPAPVHQLVRNKPLAGVWDLTVTVHLPDGTTSVTTPRFTFAPDHKLSAQGPPDDAGSPLYAATGYWQDRGDGTVAFYITHGGADGGAIPGTVQAVHLGKISGARFSTQAHAFVFVEAGVPPQGPIEVDSTATWVSPPPAS
ncbi:hypothetical protein [Streptomyces fragilis]|uniref:Lipocalin-like domain-containing protein n=1 Tax=Streptomyces fragilis TaxID=67301 RepID=A0ABV2YNZ8_9ACTN|nr:hypothetical protein [Streptomyces fragilis]